MESECGIYSLIDVLGWRQHRTHGVTMTGKGTTSSEIHRMKCNGLISSRYQGAILEVEQNRGWIGYCSAEVKCLNLHEKWYLKENMDGTTIAKGRIPDIRTYTKGILNLREAFMISSTSCPWAWTQSSRSTPTSSMHNLSFTALDKNDFSVKTYQVNY